MKNRFVKYLTIFLICSLSSISAYTDQYLAYPDPSNTDNCESSTSCSMTSCSDSTVKTDCSTANIDLITKTFFNLMASRIALAPNGNGTGSGLGVSGTEGIFITCNATNDSLQSCLYGGNFTTGTIASSATGNPRVQAVVDGVRQYDSGSSVGAPLYCPLTRCDVQTNDIHALYTNEHGDVQRIIATVGDTNPIVINGNSWENSGIGGFRALQVGNQVCLAMQTPKGYAYLGCKAPPIQQAANTSGPSCMTGGDHSKSFFSVTGRAVECVSNLLETSLMGNDSLLMNLRNGVRNIIQIALVLYVITFGIHIVLGQETPQKGEVTMFLAKMILVIYFSVGFGDQNGMDIIAYPLLKAAMSGFSDMILSAAGNNAFTTGEVVENLCYYNPDKYDSGYDYLALWDSLDCRIGYYLGFFSINPTAGSAMNIIFLIFPFLLGGKILYILLILCFGIFFLSIAVFFVHVYIICMIGLAVMTYLSPIFVPFALFGPTKHYFESWMHVLFSFALQPMILTAFLAIMLSVFDSIYYGDCQFSASMLGQYKAWVITSSDTKCTETLGYILSNKDGMISSVDLLFFNVDIATGNVFAGTYFLKTLFQVVIFTFLFFFFAEKVGDIAAEITGGPDFNKLSLHPNKISSAVADWAKSKMTSRKDDKDKGGAETKATTTDPSGP